MKVKTSPGVIVTSMKNDCVVMNTSDESVHVVNSTAGWILDSCLEMKSMESLVSDALNQFDVPGDNDTSGQIASCVADMKAKGLVSVH